MLGVQPKLCSDHSRIPAPLQILLGKHDYMDKNNFQVTSHTSIYEHFQDSLGQGPQSDA